jgi:hypothetical protein
MAYKRKTADEWDIEGMYCGQWEVVTTETTREKLKANMKAYRENEPGTAFRVKKHRVPIEV